MRNVAALVAAALLAGAATASDFRGLDREALRPIMSHSWIAGGTCDAPEAVVDWVIDDDRFYRREESSFTELTRFEFGNGRLVTHDEVGIGLTQSIYRLDNGTLRLWTETFFEDGDAGKATPTVQVRDGIRLSGEAGVAAEPTPSLRPCPLRETLFPSATIAALNGKWAALEGGACAEGAGSILFRLDRPVPRISRDLNGDTVGSEAYVLSIANEGGGFVLTEGSSLEASTYRYSLASDGTLTETAEQEGAPAVRLRRCL